MEGEILEIFYDKRDINQVKEVTLEGRTQNHQDLVYETVILIF